jgi:serine/threonine protein kinase/WD40 repeat protein
MTVAADPRIGTELAGYRIEALLGRGGMGVVYLAEQLRLKRRVALKLLAPELADDDRFRERFLRESELAASIDHSNIIPIYDAGEAEGLLYIAMRYVKGTDLGTLLVSEGRLEPDRAVAIIGAVASALDAAHTRGLVHRDVKPGNVLLAEDGTIYLADFGLTRSADDRGSADKPHLSGTPEYIAPEQIEGGDLAASADIYSLGCVLYHCLAGKSPFGGSSPVGLLFAHLEKPPPSLTEQRPELPQAIDQVIAIALAKEPAERYRSCQELGEAAGEALGLRWLTKAREWDDQHRERSLLLRGSDLGAAERYLDSIGAGADPALTALQRQYVSASRASVSRRQRALVAASVAVAAIAVVLLVFALISRSHATSEAKRADASAEQAREAAAQAEAAETTQLAQRLGAQALLDDDLGRSLLLARQAVAIEDSAVTRSDLLTDLQRFPAATHFMDLGAEQIALSPDGRVLIAAAGEAVEAFDTKSLEQLRKSGGSGSFDVSGLAFSPDGRTLAMTTAHVYLRLIDPKTLEATRANIYLDGNPVGVGFSPDGKLLATAEQQLQDDGSPSGEWLLILRDPTTGEQTGSAINAGVGTLSFAFTPDRRSVLTSNESAALTQWDLATRRPTKVLQGTGGALAVSPDGVTAAVGRADGTVSLIDLHHSWRERPVFGQHSAPVTFAAFSPDGKTVATGSNDKTVILWDVASGTQRDTLHGHSAPVRGAAFSRDGKTLYTISEDGSVIVWGLAHESGLGRPFVFTGDTNTREQPGWHPGRISPDGKLIAAGLAGGGIGLWDANDLESQVARLGPTDGDVVGLDFSLDGKTLAAVTAKREVTFWDVESRSLLHGPWKARWNGTGDPPPVTVSPDGSTFAVSDGDALRLWDATTGADLGLLGDGQAAFDVAFDPTGQLIAMIGPGSVFPYRDHEVWDLKLHKKVATLAGGQVAWPAGVFSPDGRTLATVGESLVQLWDARTGELISQLDRRSVRGAGGPIPGFISVGASMLDFSPDGKTLAVSGSEGVVSLWDVATGAQIGRLEGGLVNARGSVLLTATDFSRDGKHLLMTMGDGRGVVWDVEPESWKRRACEIAGRTLTQEEWDDLMPDRPYEPACAGGSG